MTSETPNYGLTRVATGEPLTANGNAFSDRDRTTIDILLEALRSHTHTGASRLADPSGLPALTLDTGGSLSPGTVYYYRVSLIDKWGLETAASGEASVTTSSGMVADTAPIPVLSAGGTLPPSTYSYVYTWVSTAGGETTSSQAAQVVVDDDDRTVTLTLPTKPADAVQATVFRSRTGLSTYYYIGDTTTTTFIDDGLPDGCCGETPPPVNTAAVSEVIQIQPSAADQATSAVFWRAYRATTSGVYLPNSLVGQAPIGESITDSGGALLPGTPRGTSSTIGDGPSLPDASPGTRVMSVCLPEISETTATAGTDAWQFPALERIEPVQVSLICGTKPTGRVGAAVDLTLASTGGGSAVIPMADNDGAYTASWPRADEVTFKMDAWPFRFSDVVGQPDQYSGYVVDLASAGTYAGLIARDDREEVVVEPGVWTVEILAKGSGLLQVKNYRTSAVTETVLWTGDAVTVDDVDAYAWYPAGTFTASAEETVYHKLVASVPFSEVWVARIRYTAVKPILEAGTVTLRHGTVSAGTIGDKFTLTVWY